MIDWRKWGKGNTGENEETYDVLMKDYNEPESARIISASIIDVDVLRPPQTAFAFAFGVASGKGLICGISVDINLRNLGFSQ